MSIEFTDNTGKLPTVEDVTEARAAVRKIMVTAIMKLPPELAVMLPTVDRCLAVAEIVIRKAEAEAKP